jgi:hypothetical protein
MKLRNSLTTDQFEAGVSGLIEYIIITSVLMILMVILMLTVNGVMMQGPVENLLDHSFIDIGNGVSTRIVDLYVIAPSEGDISTRFDVPDDVAGRDYSIEIIPIVDGNDRLEISRGAMKRTVSLAGIGATLGVGGSTQSSGLNRIRYNSSGFP